MAEERVQTEVVAAPPAKMEFRLINPTETGFLKHIEWNKEELEAAVKAKVESYKGIVYTEDTLKSAKADKAELNNLLKAIEDRRKKVKEIINQPYSDFEKELKSVTALIKRQAEEIGKQIDSFEDKQKEEKKQKIQEAYDAAIGDLGEVLPFTKVFDPRYLNKTYRLNTAISEVKSKIERVREDLSTIESVCGKYALNAKDVYVRTLDLSKALAEERRLQELEEKLEAERIRKQKEEEERRKVEEQRKSEAERLRQENEKRLAKEEAERIKQEHEVAKKATHSSSLAELENMHGTPGNIHRNSESVSKMPESVSKMSGNVTETPKRVFEHPESVTKSAGEHPVDPFADKDIDTKIYKASFTIKGTKAEILSVKEFMVKNNIDFGKVER